MFRKKRNVAAISFALATATVVWFWVTTEYTGCETTVALAGNKELRISSRMGVVDFAVYSIAAPHVQYGYRGPVFWPWLGGTMGFDYDEGFLYSTLAMPHWFLTAVFGSLALFFGLPRLRQCSLRSLVIAAVTIAAIVYVLHYFELRSEWGR